MRAKASAVLPALVRSAAGALASLAGLSLAGLSLAGLSLAGLSLAGLSLAASGCSATATGAGPESAERAPRAADAEPSALTRQVEQELTLIGEAFEELARGSHLALDVSLGEQLANMRKELGWLARKAPSWPASVSLQELVSALQQHRELLAELRLLPSEEARPLISALLRDLEVKAQQCRRFGGPVPVNVSVVTRDTEHREVTGYEVWFVRKAYERKPQAFRRFDRNSSPAGRVFQEAGYYVLWAVPPGQSPNPASTRLDVEVGATEQDQVFDLTAPVTAVATAPVGVWAGATAPSR